MTLLDRIDVLIKEAREDRAHFHNRFIGTGNHGFSIEAAACAIREKALLDARDLVSRATPDYGQMVQAMLRARDSLGNCTGTAAAEACAEAAFKLMGRV